MTTQFNLATRRTFGIGLVSMLLAGAALAQQAAGGMTDPAADRAFEAAQEAYERSHWAAAYDGFAALADRGHAGAARIALLMVRHGPALYGQAFSAGAQRLQRWSALASCAEGGGAGACRLAQRAP